MTDENQKRIPETQNDAISNRAQTGGEQAPILGHGGGNAEAETGKNSNQSVETATKTKDASSLPNVEHSSIVKDESVDAPLEQEGSLADNEITIKEKEIAKLTLQISEYYNSSYKWAQIWMTLYVFFLCFELFLVTVYVSSIFISYQKELLPASIPISNLITWPNVRVLMIAIFLINLLIIIAANFNKRWRLNQSTMRKLATLKVDLTDSSGELGTIRTTLKSILDDHNQGLQKQKILWGPEVK